MEAYTEGHWAVLRFSAFIFRQMVTNKRAFKTEPWGTLRGLQSYLEIKELK